MLRYAMIGLLFLNVLVTSWLAITIHSHVNSTGDSPSRVDYIVHDLTLDVETRKITQVRTATMYPLQVSWVARMVDHFTGTIYCEGHGISTIEYKKNDKVVLDMDVWVGEPCPGMQGRTVSVVGQWYWSDLNGAPRTTGFRSDPYSIPVVPKR